MKGKIRIAVAVDENGWWQSYGCGRFGDEPMADDYKCDRAARDVDGTRNCYIIEVEVETPTVPVLDATAQEVSR